MGGRLCKWRPPPQISPERAPSAEVDESTVHRYLRQRLADRDAGGISHHDNPFARIANALPDFEEFRRDEAITKGMLENALQKRPFVDVFLGAFTDFPNRFTASIRALGPRHFFLKWFCPAFLNAVCMFTCMLLLHIATFYYVREMLAWEHNYEVKPDAKFHGWIFSNGEGLNSTSFGSLNDPLEAWLGYRFVSIEVLDKIAAFFPMCFMLVVVLLLDLRTWTKILLCNALLALGKGLLGAMTTVPDSAGWAACKARLNHNGAQGVDFFKHHGTGDLFWMELLGAPESHKHLRWCSDMMYSGHTYMTCLYALGLYELVRIWFSRVHHGLGRIGPLLFVVLLAVGEQSLEIYCVLKSHFHYSSDVFAAVAATLLVYTNGAVSIAAKRWALLGTNPASTMPRAQLKRALNESRTNLTDSMREALEQRASGVGLQSFRSGGDVLIPPCCVPFCCLTGREHLFDDAEVEQIFQMLGAEDDLSRNFLRLELRMGEGVHKRDLEAAMKPMEGHMEAALERMEGHKHTRYPAPADAVGGGGDLSLRRPMLSEQTSF